MVAAAEGSHPVLASDVDCPVIDPLDGTHLELIHAVAGEDDVPSPVAKVLATRDLHRGHEDEDVWRSGGEGGGGGVFLFLNVAGGCFGFCCQSERKPHFPPPP